MFPVLTLALGHEARDASTVLRPYRIVGIAGCFWVIDEFGIVARGIGVRVVLLAGAVLMLLVFQVVRKDHDDDQHDDDHADIPPVVIVTVGVSARPLVNDNV